MTTLTKDGLQKVLLRIYEQGSELGNAIKNLSTSLEKLEARMNKCFDKADQKYNKLQKDVQKLTDKNETTVINEPVTAEFISTFDLTPDQKQNNVSERKANESSTAANKNKRSRHGSIVTPASSTKKMKKSHESNSEDDATDNEEHESDAGEGKKGNDVCKICLSRDPKTRKKRGHTGNHIRGTK